MIVPIQPVKPGLPRDFVYDILAPPLCLLVDVGAAAGEITRRLALKGDASTRVVAFEPFPPNLPYFNLNTRDLSSVKLVEKAVSDRIGTASFHVPSTVYGTETEWEDHIGYSSVGSLATDLLERIKHLILRSERLQVETTTLDAEFDEVIDFLKVDVQGAEPLVLAGASKLLSNHSVLLAYVEWAGDPKVPGTLAHHGYVVYDSHYVGWSPRGPDPFVGVGFQVVEEIHLSTGVTAFGMVNREVEDVAGVLQHLNQVRRQWIQTDLIALPEERRFDFEASLDGQ